MGARPLGVPAVWDLAIEDLAYVIPCRVSEEPEMHMKTRKLSDFFPLC
jgi:hypothetical protein